MVDWYRRVTADADVALVEGAGGWRVPLHPEGFLSDLPEALQLDVILVVGLTLGCLNHARLTAEAIATRVAAGCAGWVANAIDPGFERRAGEPGDPGDLARRAPPGGGWPPGRDPAVCPWQRRGRIRQHAPAAVRPWPGSGRGSAGTPLRKIRLSEGAAVWREPVAFYLHATGRRLNCPTLARRRRFHMGVSRSANEDEAGPRGHCGDRPDAGGHEPGHGRLDAEPARRRHRTEPRNLRPAHAGPLGLRGDRRGGVQRDDLFDRHVP